MPAASKGWIPPAILIAAATVAPNLARAAESPPQVASLGWVRLAGAESCAGAREVADAVEKRLGRTVFVAPARAELAVEGRVEPAAPGGWRAVITLSDARGAVLGTRELHTGAADCRSLDDAIALALALMIDADALISPAPARPPPPEAPRCAPAPPPPASRWHAGAQAGFTVGLGMLPRAGAGVSTRLRAVPPRGPVFEAGAAIWVQQNDTLRGPLGADFGLAYGSLSVCPLALGGAGTTFLACGGVQVGSLWATGVGFAQVYRQAQVVVDLAAEAHLRRALVGPFFAALGVGLVVPTIRDRFDVLSKLDVLFQPSPVAGTAEAAFGLSFP